MGVPILDHSRSVDKEQEPVEEVGEEPVELDGGHIEIGLAVGTNGKIKDEAGDQVGRPQGLIKKHVHEGEHCEGF